MTLLSPLLLEVAQIASDGDESGDLVDPRCGRTARQRARRGAAGDGQEEVYGGEMMARYRRSSSAREGSRGKRALRRKRPAAAAPG